MFFLSKYNVFIMIFPLLSILHLLTPPPICPSVSLLPPLCFSLFCFFFLFKFCTGIRAVLLLCSGASWWNPEIPQNPASGGKVLNSEVKRIVLYCSVWFYFLSLSLSLSLLLFIVLKCEMEVYLKHNAFTVHDFIL